MKDICIIGGGASGLAAAISAAEEKPGAQIVILEKKETAAKKVAASGNGKCNLSNEACPKLDMTLNFFKRLGVATRTDEEGRIYPYSMQAKDVVKALLCKAQQLGVDIKTRCQAEKAVFDSGNFSVSYNGGVIEAKKLLLSTGGKAGPQFGTSGDGYHFAKAAGHRVTRLAPVLTGIEIDGDFRKLKGIRVDACAVLEKDNRKVAAEAGQVQFNEDGISGICVMNLSRFVKLEKGELFSEGIRRYQICLDFIPEMEKTQILEFLKYRCKLSHLKAGDLLLSILPASLGEVLLQQAGINLQAEISRVPEDKLCKLSDSLKNWKLPMKGTKGWKTAQCTAGGVCLEEIDLDTMESLLMPGLYFSGEIIDFDGPCGGFNLQNAWETGIKAGRAMANAL